MYIHLHRALIAAAAGLLALGTAAPAVADTQELKLVEHATTDTVTDTGSEVRRAVDKPGITNLIEILAAVRGVSPESIEREFEGSQYGPFKQAVAEAVIEYLTPVRERYQDLRDDESGLERTLALGAEKAGAIASETLADVREVMGVGPVRARV